MIVHYNEAEADMVCPFESLQAKLARIVLSTSFASGKDLLAS